MGRSIEAYTVFGFITDCDEVNSLFGKKSKDVSDYWGNDGYVYRVPWKPDEELSCTGEVVNEICVHIKKTLGVETSFVDGGSYFNDDNFTYGIGPDIGVSGGFIELETLMRAEQNASEIGAFLKTLGFEINEGPRIFSLWQES